MSKFIWLSQCQSKIRIPKPALLPPNVLRLKKLTGQMQASPLLKV